MRSCGVGLAHKVREHRGRGGIRDGDVGSRPGLGGAAGSTSMGSRVMPGEFTTISRLTPFLSSLSGSSRCRASASAGVRLLPWVGSRF